MKRKTILFILIVTFCFTGCKKIDQNTGNNEQPEESVIDDDTEFVPLYDVTTPAYECKEEIGKINIEQKKALCCLLYMILWQHRTKSARNGRM